MNTQFGKTDILKVVFSNIFLKPESRLVRIVSTYVIFVCFALLAVFSLRKRPLSFRRIEISAHRIVHAADMFPIEIRYLSFEILSNI